MLSSEALRAKARCFAVSISPVAVCGLSNCPLTKITRRMWPTLSSIVAVEIFPDLTSGSTFSGASQPPPLPAAIVSGSLSHSSIGVPPGISKSMPAFTVAAELYVLPQSETTKPLKFQCCLSISFNK